MNHNYLYIAAIASLLIFGACSHKDKDAAPHAPDIIIAEAFTDSVVIHKTFPGVVEAMQSVEVQSQTTGRIVQRCFRDGDYVRQGQVLYILDSKAAEAQVAQAQAAIAQAQSQYEYYVRQSDAMKEALAADAVAEITARQAESNVKSYAAQLAAAKAKLTAARIELAYCKVTAPISGRTQQAAEVGEFATTGTSLVKIVDNSRLKVSFSIDESHFRALAGEGLKDNTKTPLFAHVPVTFEGGAPVYADLYYVSPSVDVSTGSVSLQGTITDATGVLRDGMYANVELPMSVNPKAVLVNDASIGTDLRGKYVYVVNDSDKVVYTPVSIGETVADTLRIITSGIKPGERYVRSALLTVRNGEKINPVKH